MSPERLPSLRRRTEQAHARLRTYTPTQQAAVGELLILMAGDNVTDLGMRLSEVGRNALALAHSERSRRTNERLQADVHEGRVAVIPTVS